MRLLFLLITTFLLTACTGMQVTLLDGVVYSFPDRPEIVVENGSQDFIMEVLVNGRSKGQILPGQGLTIPVPGGRNRTVSVIVRLRDEDGVFLGTTHKNFRFGRISAKTQTWIVRGPGVRQYIPQI